MDLLTSLQIKQISSSPILESMVFVNIAVNFAIALNVKDKKQYKNLKKHYYIKRKIVRDNTKKVMKITSGWYILNLTLVKFIGKKCLYNMDSHETIIWYYTWNGIIHYTLHKCLSGQPVYGTVWVSYIKNGGGTGPIEPFNVYLLSE